MMDEKLKTYAIYGLLVLLFSIIGAWVNRERSYEATEATLIESKTGLERSLQAARESIVKLEASIKRGTDSQRDSKVTVMPDGTRIEELKESVKTAEELWTITTEAYAEKILELETENERLRKVSDKTEVKVSRAANRPFSLGFNWIGSPVTTGAVDIDLGYHFDFGSFDLGPHVGTALAGEKALAPLGERPYRFGIQGRF